jgi:hypothetical protein
MDNKKKSSNTPVTDRSWYYSDLAMMPQDDKESRLWCAQLLFYAKINSNILVDSKKAAQYRKNTYLDIDENVYKRIIDPVTVSGGGGTADYVAADWKALPIAVHLRNIRKAKLDKIGVVNKPQVNEINKFSKSQRQKDKDKIIHQRVFRELIQQVIETLNLPPISENQTPEEYISKLEKSAPQTEQKEGEQPVDGGTQAVDDVSRIMQQIQMQIKDSQDYQLYERYVYKGEIERAFELAITHYLINQNKWRNVSEFFNEDLVNFNKACGQWYIDNTTGRGVVRYLDPARLYTSPFKLKDGSDILYWFYEEPMLFSDFIKSFGTTLTDEQLKEVFELNKYSGGTHMLDWESTNPHRRNNAMINVGMASVLTQESTTFGENYVKSPQPTYPNQPVNFDPDKDSSEIKQTIYNVWHSFYYVPPPSSTIVSNIQTDWVWQSRYIFNIKKETDMFRYGVDERYAKSSLVVWKDNSPSCTDIEESILPKIYTTWHKFQNCLVQDTQAVVIDEDFVLGILNATDEANAINGQPQPSTGSNGINAGMEAFKMMRQGGLAMMKFRDKNGNVIPGLNPKDFFVNVDSGHIKKAEQYLQLILQQYELLKMALAQSDVTEGQAAKPRTAVAGIEASIEASNNAIWFVEKPVREFLIMYSERVIQHVLNMVKEKKYYKYKERWNSFEEVIGLANSLMIEGVAEIAPEDIGITVSLQDTQQLQEYIFSLCNDMVKNNKMSFEAAALAIETASVNYKYAYALISLFVKQKEAEVAAQQQLQFEQQMQLQDKQLEIAQTLQGQKIQGNADLVKLQAQMDSLLEGQVNQQKFESQARIKEITTENRIREADAKMEKEHNLEQQKSLLTS